MGASGSPVRPRRSAFAAAFLSFIFPGLGHAYLGRWLRALLWALPVVILLAVAAALALSPDRSEYIAALADPDMLLVVLGFILLDLLYRLAALLDAWRLARDPGVGAAGARMLSAVGLVAIVLVLIASHVAVARPVYLAYDTITAVTDNSGDMSALPDLSQLGEEFQVVEVTPTPPPTLGEGATPTPAAAATPTPAPTPTPSVGPGWDGKKRLDILLVGADGGRQGEANASYLTDTMIVVSVDPATGRVAFISLPRDTSGIPLPRSWPAYDAFGGTYTNKINTLYTVARGRPDLFPGSDQERGFKALMGALSELYGLDIQYYVAVDLNSFRRVVNALGGVVIDVQLPVYDTGYPTDDGRGKLKLYVPPGMAYMNGQRALAYARSRHGSSDYVRSARQQRVITSVRDQLDLPSLFAPGVIDKLVDQVKRHVKTNVPPKLIPKLVSLAQDVDLERRESLVLSDPVYSSICYPCPPNGLWVLKANPAKMRAAAQNVFSDSAREARKRNEIAEEGAVVWVQNGAGGANTRATLIAESLSAKGMDAIVPPIADGRADRDDYPDTVIRYYNGAKDQIPRTVAKLRSTFKGATIEEVDDPAVEADVIVIVGESTKTPKGGG